MGKKSVPNSYVRFCDSRNAYPQREIPYTEAAIDDYLRFTLKRACDEKTCEAQRKSIILEAKSIKDRMLEKLFPKGERDISEERLSFDDGFPVRILYLGIAKELNKAGRGDLFGLELLMR